MLIDHKKFLLNSLFLHLQMDKGGSTAAKFDEDVSIYETPEECNIRLKQIQKQATKMQFDDEGNQHQSLTDENRNRLKMLQDETKAITAHRTKLQEQRKEDEEFLALTKMEFNSDRGFESNPMTKGNPSAKKTLDVKVKSEGFKEDPKAQFNNIHEFLNVVMTVGRDPESPRARKIREEPRMKFLSAQNVVMAAGSDEHSGQSDAYGAFLIPTGLLPGVRTTDVEADFMAPFMTILPMEYPQVELIARTDKNHTTSVSGGLQVYRRAETQDVSATRMELERVQYNANSLMGITYITEELVENSPATVIGMIENGFDDEFAAKLVKERIRGNGVGEFEGILNAPSLVTVSKESGQSADTIVGQNLLNMRARCWGYRNAIWIANLDCYSQVVTAHVTDSAGTAGIIKMFNQDLSNEFEGRILGRPVFFTEFASTLGDVGDIMCVNLREYIQMNNTPVRRAESVHVRFLNNERTFRFMMKNDAKTHWRSTFTPNQGSNTLSPLVTLEERT